MTWCIKKKANQDNDIDRISDLPRNVIDGILECLPIRDVVRTSILSRKWRYMLVSVPRLEFEEKFFGGIRKYRLLPDHEIPNIIMKVLLLHNGPVYKFTLDIPSDYAIRIGCLSQWILFLSRSGVKDLELVNQQMEPYQMPSHLFSCLELTHLELSYFRMSLPPNFCGFKSLLGLHLYGIIFESSTLESLISCCPLVEELTISYCSGFECLNVSTPTLKILYIEDGRLLKSICFKKAKNLIDLTIILNRSGENSVGGRESNLVNFFSSLPKIERLCLVDGYIKVLSAGRISEMLPTSSNSLKHLELDGVNFDEPGEILFIIRLIKSSPNLVKLVIKSRNMAMELPGHLTEFDCNSCCLSQLRTVNNDVETAPVRAVELAEFLLKNSPSLEILTFKVGLGVEQSDSHLLLLISGELLLTERASPRAKVNFLYDDLNIRDCI